MFATMILCIELLLMGTYQELLFERLQGTTGHSNCPERSDPRTGCVADIVLKKKLFVFLAALINYNSGQWKLTRPITLLRLHYKFWCLTVLFSVSDC